MEPAGQIIILMIYCRNYVEWPSCHHFFLFSAKRARRSRCGQGARVRWVWGCAGRHRGSGVLCIQWGHLSNTRPGNFFLHVEYPRPPPPRGAAAVLVLDGKCGNGCGNVVRSAVIVLHRPEWVSARGCERASLESL